MRVAAVSAFFDQIVIDPDPEEVAKALSAGVAVLNQRRRSGVFVPSAQEVAGAVALLRREAEGVRLWRANDDPGQRSTDVLLAWWSDALRRKHVRIAGRRREPYLELWSARLVHPGTARPAPWLLYPDRLYFVQKPDQPLELHAVCGCGAAGSLEKLGWMGPTCGPCHDRREESGEAAPALPPAVLRGQDAPVRCAKFVPGTDLLAALHGQVRTGPQMPSSVERTSAALLLWDLRTGKSEGLGPSASGLWYSCLSISPDGQTLAHSRGTRITVWDVARRAKRATITASGDVTGTCFTPDGQGLALLTTHHRALYRPRVPGGPWQSSWSVAGGGRALALAPDGTWMAVDEGPNLAIQQVGTHSSRAWGGFGWRGIKSLAVSPDGKAVALALEGSPGWNRPGGVRTWDVPRETFGAVNGQHPQPVNVVAFTPDGKYVVSGGVDRSVRFWSTSSGELHCTLLWHLGGIQAIDFSADGQALATGSSDGTVKLWPWRALVEGT